MKNRKAGFVSPSELLAYRQQQTYTERFDMLMRLIRLSRLVASARVIEKKK